MRAIKVDSNRNPVIKNGSFVWVYDEYVIAQNCDHAMRQQLGELNYSVNKGIDYLGNVMTGAPNFQRFEARARVQILNVEGVTGISSFSYSLSEGVLSYTCTIKTTYSTATTITGEI